MRIRDGFTRSLGGGLSVPLLILGIVVGPQSAMALTVSGVPVTVDSGGGVPTMNNPLGPVSVVSALPRAGEVNITTSRHNLGTTNVANSNHTPQLLADDGITLVGTNEICVFCHTPHGFNTTQVSAPLWNKGLNHGAYQTFNIVGNISSTLDGEVLPIGSVSLACLSCHDGSQAMDTMINGPGSGNMSGNGTNGMSGARQGYVWTQFSQMNANGTANGGIDNMGNPLEGGINIGGVSTNDLSNDHPIGIQYCGGGITYAANSNVGATVVQAMGVCSDNGFNRPLAVRINGSLAFWVDTLTVVDPSDTANGLAVTRDATAVETWGPSGYIATPGPGVTLTNELHTRTKSDLMLFNRAAFATGEGPSVECASCHDPHTPTNARFLRVSNNGSGLCLSCHVK